MPESYNIVINAENPLISALWEIKELRPLLRIMFYFKQVTDLALLANNMLKGKELSDFIKRSAELL